jgi:hypothetical protein
MPDHLYETADRMSIPYCKWGTPIPLLVPPAWAGLLDNRRSIHGNGFVLRAYRILVCRSYAFLFSLSFKTSYAAFNSFIFPAPPEFKSGW